MGALTPPAEGRPDPGDLLGGVLRVVAQLPGHRRRGPPLHLDQPQQLPVRLRQVPQGAQGDRLVAGRGGEAGGAVGRQPGPQLRAEPVSVPVGVPVGGGLPYGGQEERKPREALAEAPGAAVAGLPDASPERLGGEPHPVFGAGGAQLRVIGDRVPVGTQQRRRGGGAIGFLGRPFGWPFGGAGAHREAVPGRCVVGHGGDSSLTDSGAPARGRPSHHGPRGGRPTARDCRGVGGSPYGAR